jgi:hypothetical protein
VTSYTHLLDEREAAAAGDGYGDAMDAPRPRKPMVAVEDEARLRIAQLAAVRAEVRFRLRTPLGARHTRMRGRARAHTRTRARMHTRKCSCMRQAMNVRGTGTPRTLLVLD